jgi:type I restriction enzyme S subunit
VKSGWTTKPLDEACTFINGLWKGEKAPLKMVGVIRNTNFTKDGTLDDSDIALIEVEAKKFEKRKLSPGDVILEKSGGGPKQPVGRVVLFDKPAGDYSFSNFTAAIRVKSTNEVDSRFLHKFLHWTYLSGVTEGMQSHSTGIRNLDGDKYKAIQISYPGIEEQRRIVSLLDEAFADIAIAKVNAEKNLQNSRGLFASRMQKLFDEDQSWERVQLEELLSRGWITSHLDGNHGSDYPRKEEFVDSGVPYIAARSLRGWEVDFNEAKYLTHERAATIRKGLAQDGDVLFAHNATVGPVGILKTNEPFVILGTSLTYYRCKEDFILPEYLAHYMRSPAFVDQYSQVMKQSTRNQVPITKQREFFHVIPPLSIQQKIASDLDSLAEKIEQLESIYHEKLTALDDLKKSLLHQAFHGQL